MRLGFFNAEQVCRLAKISATQLRYWHETKVFEPTVLDGAGAFRHVYSFRDVVGLRTISILRNKYGVDLEDIRLIEQKLKTLPESDWSNLMFYVGQDHRIYFKDPKSGDTIATNPMGQRPPFRMRAIARGVEKNLARIHRRTPKEIGKIERGRFVMRNDTVIAGTRIPTSAIWDFHKAGYSDDEILKQFPRLTLQDVRAAIQYEGLKVRRAVG